jgi:Rieske Fe-S protein
MDHAPFIGRSSSTGESYLVATGFNAWGITTGTAAAILIADLVDGKENDWLKLFDATRLKPVAGAAELAKGTAGTAAHLIGGYVRRKPHDLASVGAGEGAVLKVDGHNVAAYRDEAGTLHACSAVCTHMGCIVGWNETDRTWDCRCQGSRFALEGSVIHGPGVSPVAPADIRAETQTTG